MPSKVDKYTLNKHFGEEYDRRKKLTSEQKKEMLELYNTGDYTQTEITKMYGVSRKILWRLLNPDRAKAGDDRSNSLKTERYTDKHRRYIADLRNYKKTLLEKEKPTE